MVHVLLNLVADYFTVMLPRITATWSVSDWATNIFMLVLMAMTLGVAGFYITRLRFWDTPAGLTVAGFLSTIGALLVINVLGVWFDREYWARDVIRPTVYIGAAINVTAIGVTMARGYREAGRLKADIAPRKLKE